MSIGNGRRFPAVRKTGQNQHLSGWAYQDWLPNYPVVPAEPVPAGVDYDMAWPAPNRPSTATVFILPSAGSGIMQAA